MNSDRKKIFRNLRKFGIIFLTILIIIILLFKFIEFIIFRHPLSREIFSSPQEALKAYEQYEFERKDTSLDYKPPYEYVDTIYIEDKGILIYTDGSYDLVFAFLKKIEDNKWKFIDGYANLTVKLNSELSFEYLLGNVSDINIKNKKYTICFSYLPIDSEQDIYVDGIKSEKIPITIPSGENSIQIYLCYALSNKVENKHEYELK